MKAGFKKVLDGNTADLITRLVYADWLEEQGDLELSFTQRWMVKYNKFPVNDVTFQYWFWLTTTGIGDYPFWYLSLGIFRKLVLGELEESYTRKYLTREVAEEDLSQAIYKL